VTVGLGCTGGAGIVGAILVDDVGVEAAGVQLIPIMTRSRKRLPRTGIEPLLRFIDSPL
jgi:hypothetical protein